MFCSKCGSALEDTFDFCPKCGEKIKKGGREGEKGSDINEQQVIESYFYSGYEYDAIRSFLVQYHGIEMSMSTLKRRLKEYGLKRKGADLDDSEVKSIIQRELDGPGCLSGYRSMWHTLRLMHGVNIPRSKVQCLLKELDPTGTEERRRHRLKRRAYKSSGPNECWHVDGYDKLKPFGFPIHGAVDGYSRRVLWLKVSSTNNNPSVVASFFLDCIRELQGCPEVLRTDPGTENGKMAIAQCFLRANDADEFSGEKAHRYGTSTGNQRIECWWSHFRKSRTTWWINFFKNLTDRGIVKIGNTYYNECLWFCFNKLLQEDLDFVRLHWNTHYIRASRHDTVPGKPDELFFLPERSGGEDHLKFVEDQQIQEAVAGVDAEHDNVDNDYQQYFNYVCNQQGLENPKTWHEALSLFHHMLSLES